MSLNLIGARVSGADNGTGVPKGDGDEGSFAHAIRHELGVGGLDHTGNEQEEKPDDGKVIVESINDKYIKSATGHETHWNKPHYKGQSKEEGRFSFSHQKAEVLDLSSDKGLDRYNKLLQMAGAPGSDPQIHICANRTEFHDGRFVALVHYVEYWYLLPEQH